MLKLAWGVRRVGSSGRPDAEQEGTERFSDGAFHPERIFGVEFFLIYIGCEESVYRRVTRKGE